MNDNLLGADTTKRRITISAPCADVSQAVRTAQRFKGFAADNELVKAAIEDLQNTGHEAVRA
jgi:hypothetical protein